MKNKNIKIVIGANFGDEGKGLLTNYFVSEFPKNETVINVRFSGGANAGHTIELKNGRRHVFSHFGSGSYNKNCITFLSSDFIINPILFKKELDILKKENCEPIVIVDKNCIFTTPYEMLSNQVIENMRGRNRHGSCGVGINDTVERAKSNKNNNTIGYLKDMSSKDRKSFLINFLQECKQYAIDKIYSENDRKNICCSKETMELFDNENILNNYIEDVLFLLEYVNISEEKSVMKQFDNFVFEGSQGLLLDQYNLEYAPHLTTANTGIKNVKKIINCFNDDLDNINNNIETCYITRSYLTRHGNGLLKTECDIKDINKDIIDKTNVTNTFQGKLRFGYIDLEDLFNRINKDRDIFFTENISIAITHLNETNNSFAINKNEFINISNVKYPYFIKNIYLSDTLFFDDIKKINDNNFNKSLDK